MREPVSPVRRLCLALLFVPFVFLSQGQATADVPEDKTPTIYVNCLLERIGTQLVRCDNLTGAGVDAPYWIPEQK
ncbi:hypothetical protein [Paenarthrobacter sp. 2TAF44]|uniref:hypothetical protein n=1 Tax=Paenarthrobacter sp. 2TAF44 TaxID=3233018 RepID=UPI003F9763A7